jgi:hypothetical protein
MSDLRDFLNGGVDDFDPPPEQALDTTIQRVRRRGRRRVVLTGAATFGVIAAMVGGLWWAFSPSPARRPIIGSGGSPSLDTSTSPWEPEGTGCRKLHMGRGCFTRTGPDIALVSGTAAGGDWSLRAFRAIYRGTDPEAEEGTEPREVTQSSICSVWVFAGPPAVWCYGISEVGWIIGMSATASSDSSELDTASPEPSDPLRWLPWRVEGSTHPSVNALYGWTPTETARLVVELDDGLLLKAEVTGPFEEDLGTDVKWWVAFLPPLGTEATLRAFDENGELIWEDDDNPVFQRLTILTSGGGSGTVIETGKHTRFWPTPPSGEGRPVECRDVCTYAFPPDLPAGLTEATFEARSDDGSVFVGWSGACAGEGAVCTVTIQETTEITATFEET